MRLSTPLLAVCVLSALPAFTGAEPASAARVTYEIRSLRLDRAAAFFDRLAHTTIVVEAPLSDLPITVSIKNLPQDEAVQAFVDAIRKEVPDIEFEKKAGVYRVRLKPGAKLPAARSPRAEANSARKISVAIGNLPLREALALVHRKPGVPVEKLPVQVEGDVPDPLVNLIFSDDEESTLARYVVRQAATAVRDLRLEEKDGRFVVGIRPDAPRDGSLGIRVKLPPIDPASRRIALGFKAAPLRYVVQSVLGAVLPSLSPSPEYVIDADTPDTPVTFSLVTADPDEALAVTLAELKKQVRGLNVRTENGKLRFSGPMP